MVPCILLTGFEPFGGDGINPSAEIVRALDGETVAGHRIVGVQLPCEFGRSLVALDAAVVSHRPAMVLALGQAGGRTELSIERIAINVDDARIPDNAGASPIDAPVVAGGPAAYFSTLPIKAMVQALRDAGIAASISQTAGTFVCNHVFYGLAHHLAGSGVRGGFMHLPLLPEQAVGSAGLPSMPLQTMIEGVRIALATAVATTRDASIGGGAIA